MCAVCGFCGHIGSLYVFTNCSLFAKVGSLSYHVCQFGFDTQYRVKICLIILTFVEKLFQNCLQILNLPQTLSTLLPNPSWANKHGACDLCDWLNSPEMLHCVREYMNLQQNQDHVQQQQQWRQWWHDDISDDNYNHHHHSNNNNTDNSKEKLCSYTVTTCALYLYAVWISIQCCFI